MPSKVPTYKPSWMPSKQERDKQYNSRRDPEAMAFYNTAAWRKLSKVFLLQNPLCDDCKKLGRLVPATHAHHTLGLGENLEHAHDMATLQALCRPCHSRFHMKENRHNGKS
jgi:5-methylcytosine-specific restriction enzyme A